MFWKQDTEETLKLQAEFELSSLHLSERVKLNRAPGSLQSGFMQEVTRHD